MRTLRRAGNLGCAVDFDLFTLDGGASNPNTSDRPRAKTIDSAAADKHYEKRLAKRLQLAEKKRKRGASSSGGKAKSAGFKRSRFKKRAKK